MKMLLHKLSLKAWYYAATTTVAGLCLATLSWLASLYVHGYNDFLSQLDLSWISISSVAVSIFTIFSLAIYDKFVDRRALKTLKFFNNDRMMWQLSSFLLVAIFASVAMLIFKKGINIHLTIGLNVTYTLFACYFLFSYLRMLFTSK